MNRPAVSRRIHALIATALLGLTFSDAPAHGTDDPGIRFEASPLPFQFQNGSRNRHDLVEIMGGGVALIDADGDGLLDIYLCQGGPIVPSPGAPDPTCRLLRNRGDRTFEDISERSGTPGPSYAMGVAVGDFNGDSRDDLFVTGWRGQKLYRNLGGGRFEDVTDKAGLNSHDWSTAAAFLDFDGDGDLDLFVATYVAFDPLTAPYTAAPDGKPDYPGPEDFSAEPDHLYRNNGDGTFTDVANQAGLNLPGGRGLGAIATDFDRDGKLDLCVANDGSPCWLFRNTGNGRFEEVGQERGVAVDGRGQALAGMGVARGDVDGDGRIDWVVTNFLGRSTVLFRDEGNAQFRDASDTFGLTRATSKLLGFGVALADFDGDGWLDLAQANGHVLDRARLGEPLEMPTLLMRGERSRFVEVTKRACEDLARPILGRGLAVGDLDKDGRLDLVVAAIDAPATVYWNRSPCAPGLLVQLEPLRGSATGSRVIASINGKDQTREITSGGSYLSAHDSRVFFGLGRSAQADRIRVEWASGRSEQWLGLKPGQVQILKEGSGRPLK